MDKNYLIREAKAWEASEITSFIEQYHLPESSITQSFLLNKKQKFTAKEAALMSQSTREAVLNFPTFVAVRRDSGKIVGVITAMLSELSDLSDEDEPSELETAIGQSELLRELNTSVLEISRKARILEHFAGSRRAAKLRFLCVHKDHRGKGLSKMLTQKSIEWAKENGVHVLFSLYTSPLSKKTAESLGFKTLLDYDLRTYRNSMGEVVFADVMDENIASIMALEIKE